jgi:hypothetical protein
VFGIEGPTLLEDEPDAHTFDYANIDAPIFFCNTVEHYLFIQELFIEAPLYFSQGASGRHRFFRDFVTGKGTLDQDQWAWDELLAFLTVAQSRPVNLLLSTYWTMGAVRHGEYIAKVRYSGFAAHQGDRARVACSRGQPRSHRAISAGARLILDQRAMR